MIAAEDVAPSNATDEGEEIAVVPPEHICGNGIRTTAEACDDNNTVGGLRQTRALGSTAELSAMPSTLACSRPSLPPTTLCTPPQQVANAIGVDSRIGPKFLKSSVGFGGSCFQKDILNLVYLCETFGLHECAEYWHQVIKMNEYQKKRFSMQIVKSMFNTITGKKIAVYGFAFKKDTGDTRETASAFVCRDLLEEQAKVHVYDPQVERSVMFMELSYTLQVTPESMPGLEDNLITSPDPYTAAEGSHAIAISTEWDEFKTLDYKRIYDSMSKPAFLFDGRNILDHAALREIGFEVYAIGKPVPAKMF